MILALVVLAAGSVLVGFLGVPHALKGGNEFEKWLSRVTSAHAAAEHGAKESHAGAETEEHPVNPMEYVLMLISTVWFVAQTSGGPF